MAKLSKHTEWLSLIEISGPFLAVSVLDKVFPQGLEAIYPDSKKRIRNAYEEWCDALNDEDPAMKELHQAWIKMVLTDFLEIPEEILSSGREYTIAAEDGNGSFTPDWVIKDNDDKPMIFVAQLAPGASPNSVSRKDDWAASALDKMTKLCRINDVRLGLLTNGEEWMLVNAPNGQTSGQVTWYARLWFQEPKTLQAFSSLLGVRRFFGPENEKLPALLDESLDCLEEVTDTLGSQVRTAVEVLIQGLDKADEDRNRELLRDVKPAELYEAGLTVMMRLVFILCAEERGLLLLGSEVYDTHYAVSTLRAQLAEEADKYGAEILERRHDAWARLLSVFRAVYAGIEHEELRLPALGGSIFDPDKYPFLEGRDKNSSWRTSNPTPLPIDNRTVLLLLNSLQVLEQPGGAILLSYRALDVEQIGHIYEGLLEYTAVRTPEFTLGLRGSAKAKNPLAELPTLESLAFESEKKLLDYLKKLTDRSAAAIKNDYTKDVDIFVQEKLLAVCGGDREMLERILPFANFLRLDAWEQPLVYRKNAFMVTLGQDRRDSGTHYTPKMLTEKIVKTTLEPVVYRGVAEGLPREKWTLKTPAELLNLKVCDPAMGSGAFLVQVCRYLADRLFEAWDIAEKSGKFINTDGVVCESASQEPLSDLTDERMNTARRLIAEKCLYGVDINPLAVELAKLSIWLVTISKGRPFGFLDHNLKSGDSLLGIHDIEQLRQLKMKPDDTKYSNLFGSGIGSAVDDALELREMIREVNIRDITDVEYMESLHQEAQENLTKVKLLADLFIGEALTCKPNKLQNALDSLSVVVDTILASDYEANRQYRIEAYKKLNTDLPDGKPSRRPFHWALEFPEVFQEGGFDAVCGNPPFSGGQMLTGSLGTIYRDFLVKHIAQGTTGSADLVAYFYLNVYDLLKNGGIFGLIACNTIAEGDTRQVGLERLLKQGATIIAANPNMPWPGKAAVVISPVFIAKDIEWHGKYFLSDSEVETISAFLSAQEEWSPKVLEANKNQSFQGSIVLGLGFTMSEDEAKAFIAKDPKNTEVLFPYLNGDDLNSDPEQKPSRWVINFFDWPLDRDAEGSWITADERKKNVFLKEGHVPTDYPAHVVTDFPELYALIDEKVRPERQRRKENGEYALRKPLPQRWWQYGEKRPALYHAIGRGDAFVKHITGWKPNSHYSSVVMETSLVSKYLMFSVSPTNFVFAHRLAVFTWNGWEKFSILSSSLHDVWSRKNSSTLETRMNYSTTDCYETFPFPPSVSFILNSLGEKYENLRREVMLRDQIGLTKLYNAFHNPENKDCKLGELRQLQKQIDEAVRDAYGWTDIDLEHGFHAVSYLPDNDNIRYTISEPARIEILRRLAQLNRQRWQEEQEEKMLEIIRGTTQKIVCADALADIFQRSSSDYDITGQLYIGYPIFATPEGKYLIDAILISPQKGVILINFVEGKEIPENLQELQDDMYNKLEAKLRNYKSLLNGRKLEINIEVLTFIPALLSTSVLKGKNVCNNDNILTAVSSITNSPTNEKYYESLLSAIQSISTLRNSVHDRIIKNHESKGGKLLRLEKSIATLDTQQGKAVIETVDGVQRIRGLAGSGKTIVLALKAAYLHAQHPDWKIAVTFQTRALKAQFKRLICNFTIEQTGTEPNWDNLKIIHAWGAGLDRDEGVYYDFCLLHKITPMDFREARRNFSQGNEFDGVCKTALENIEQDVAYFNAILVDEAQDVPESFLKICYSLLDEKKRLVYAYDELQSLTKHSMPSPEIIFGNNKEGKPLVTLSTPSQDIILNKCYRNSKPVLTVAHALGFGIYRVPDPKTGTGLIQMFDNKELWKDIGYAVVAGELSENHVVTLERKSESSPMFLEDHSPVDDLIMFKTFDTKQQQMDWLIEQIMTNVRNDELRYDDIIVINPDPFSTKNEFGEIRAKLFENNINSHLVGIDTDPDVFFKNGWDSIAFSGIFRAKGNEAGMVYIINAQDCYSSFGELPTVRNRLFTAITRSKAWVRVLGVGEDMKKLEQEFLKVKHNNFQLKFTYPSEELRKKLNIVNRDMSSIEKEKIRNADRTLGELLNNLQDGSINISDIDPQKIKLLQNILKEKGIS